MVSIDKNIIKTKIKLNLPAMSKEFTARLNQYLPRLKAQLKSVYTEQLEFDTFINQLIEAIHESYLQRPEALKVLDKKRAKNPHWFQSEKMVGGVCYVDLYAKNLSGIRNQIPYFKSLGLTYLHLMPLFKAPPKHNDGGYAVSSYREVNPQFGSMADLNTLAEELRAAGISLVLDFIFNHTADDHIWAKKCVAGDADFKDFYIIYPDRTMPDLFEQQVREIFPEEHPGAFTQLEDGSWVWTTFHSYQWDLNYANPNVFIAMACEMLFIANQGAEILRMDAVAFLWKKLGTTCENLPEVHTLIQAFNTIAKIAAPSLLFKSEAIVHPDDVIKYISDDECQLSYNPLQMALLWSTLASREVNLLNQALAHRNTINDDCSWVNYVRSHDDIGWTFSDEDAAQFYINGFMHRTFLNNFYLGRFPGSFAHGVAFQENFKNGDCRICGTTASLVGLGNNEPYAIERILILYSIVMSTGGIPLIYLGDEVGILNDMRYLDDEHKSADSRWVHRVVKDESLYEVAFRNGSSSTAKLYKGLKSLISLRKKSKALGGGKLNTFSINNPSVLAYQRENDGETLFILANFSERTQEFEITDTPLLNKVWTDSITNNELNIQRNVILAPYQFMWLELAQQN